MKCIGRRNWRVTCARERELIREAIDNGLDVTMDAYPYITGSTQLVHLIPPGFQSGGTRKLLEDLKDGRKREQITKALKTPSNRFENIVELAGFENIAPIGLESGRFKPFEGCSIAGIAKNLQKDPYDTLYDILLEEECEPAMLDTYGCEEDLIDFLKEETCSLISDAIYPEGGHCHPRVYDAFPRFLIRYVREKAVFSIEEAIRKMTTLPASVYGLDRGVIAPGKTADLCVFHLDNLESHSDFIHPDRMCEGFDYVFTAGRPCVVKDEWSNTGSGEPLVTALTKTDNKS
jgi:N-acyl-D-aspartate/D-glutamate deacylase